MSIRTKAWKILAASTVLGAFLTAPASADVSTEIYYNGELLHTTQPVVNVDGHVLVAFRDLFENLDGQVLWDDKFRMASVTYGKVTVQLFPDNGAAQINGVPQALEVGPQMLGDRVYLPLRFLSQALGGTVDYSKTAEDVGIIRIHTIDSAQNYAQRDGKVLRILRTTSDPVSTIPPTAATEAAYRDWQARNSVYFMDDHDNLVEVQSYDSQIRVNVIDFHSANVDSTVYDTDLLYPALTSVRRDGRTYTVGVNEPAAYDAGRRYAGVGTPASNSYTDIVETEQSDFYVYDGREEGYVFRFDASDDSASGVVRAAQNGKVLDLGPSGGDSSGNLYASLSDGTYAFLLNGRLLILSPENEVLEETVLARNPGDRYLYTWKDRFVVLMVDRSRSYPEVCATIYNQDGSVDAYTRNISRISQPMDGEAFYDYSNLEIRDAALEGDTFYLLLKTDMDFYLVTYNARTDESTRERLSIREKNYDGFLSTLDGVKLFAADEDYFYLRDVD